LVRLDDGSLTTCFFLLSKRGISETIKQQWRNNRGLPWLWQVDGSGILGWRF
jgi:hypothetical protein